MDERRPPPHRWQEVDTARMPNREAYTSLSAWQRGAVRVISSLQDAEYPVGEGGGPTWQVSISRGGCRPSDEIVAAALRDFGMSDAEEDNHHPGIARHFWMPLDPSKRVGCECKETEAVIVEPDGYRWTNPHPGEGPCRGCELAKLLGKRCPLHPEVAGG